MLIGRPGGEHSPWQIVERATGFHLPYPTMLHRMAFPLFIKTRNPMRKLSTLLLALLGFVSVSAQNLTLEKGVNIPFVGSGFADRPRSARTRG